MKSFVLLSLFVILLWAAPQDPPGIHAGSVSIGGVRQADERSFNINYPSAFNTLPYFGLALTEFTSAVSASYIVKPKVVSQTTTGVSLNVQTPFNPWIKLVYSYVASISPSLTVYQFSSYWPVNGAPSVTTLPNGLIVPPGLIKVDTLIAGFNYGSQNFLFSIKVVPQGTITNPVRSIYSDPGITFSPYTGFLIPTGTGVNFPYVVTYDPSATSNFSELVITLVLHSVVYPQNLQSPVSTAFNTITVTDQTNYVNLFNPIGNKHNLGIKTAKRFFGFTQISLVPPSITNQDIIGGIDIQLCVNSIFNSSIYSTSVINTISASYFFYQNNANNICPISYTLTNNLISENYNPWNCQVMSNGGVTSGCHANYRSDLSYVNVSSAVSSILSFDLNTQIGATYLITFYLLDPSAVVSNPQVIVRFGSQTVSRVIATSTNPWRSPLAPTTGGIVDVEVKNYYVKYSVYVTATQKISKLEFEFGDQSTGVLKPYLLKSVSVTSGNSIYDPISQMCVSSCTNNQMISTNTIPNVCTSCSDQGRVYDPLTGTCGCPVNTFFNAATLTCDKCLESTCERCSSSPLVCSSCPTNRVLSGSKCVCASGFFDINGVCVGCNSGCTSCIGSPNACLSCQPSSGRIPVNGTCLCKPGTYDAGVATCAACPSTCLTCISSPTTKTIVCTSCPALANRSPIPINGQCPCAQGFFFNKATQQCSPCDPTCKTCSAFGTNGCTSCNSRSLRTLTNTIGGVGTCSCVQSTTQVGTSAYCVYNPSLVCTQGCSECSSGVCSACSVSENRVPDVASGTCACKTGYFVNPTTPGVCSECPASCVECNAATGFCRTCPAGTFVDRATGTCKPCAPGCVSCTSAIKCTACASLGLTLVSQTCICPVGTFFSSNVCQRCPSQNCQACDGNGKCTICTTGNVLQNGVCVKTCSGSTYSNGYVCLSCPANCQSCTGPSTCVKCAGNTILHHGLCLSSCLDGTVATTTNPPLCVPCNKNCRTCQGSPNTCTSCPTGQYLINGVCSSHCPSGCIAKKGSCIPCSGCETCFGAPQVCTSCERGQLIIFSTGQCCDQCPRNTIQSGIYCYNSCPPGTFDNGKNCRVCSSNCATCSGQANNCTSCPRSAPYLNGTTCVSSCSGLAINENNVCQRCHKSCLSCVVGQPQNCRQCAPGFTMSTISGKCLPACQGNTFNNGKSCQVCPIDCLGCYNSQRCYGCSNSAAVLVGSGTCSSCLPPCLTCVSGSSSLCTRCIAPNALSGNQCVGNCPTNQVASDGVCVCIPGTFEYQGSCVTGCPVKTVAVVINNVRYCKDCSAYCLQCSPSATTCNSCMLGYTLINGNCVPSTCAYGQIMVPSDRSCVSICPIDYLFFDSYCVFSCQPGYVPNAQKSGCIPQNNTSNNLCPSGQTSYQGLCFPSCPGGTCQSFGFCIDCIPNCAVCSNASSCSFCSIGYYLSSTGACILSPTCPRSQISFQGGCINDCPLGTIRQSNSCNRICDFGTYYHNGFCYSGECPNNLLRTEFGCVSSCPQNTKRVGDQCIGITNTVCAAGSYVTQSGVCALCQSPCATCFESPTSCTLCLTGQLQGNTCVKRKYEEGKGCNSCEVKLSIQSSSIFNNRVQVRILVNNAPSSLTQSSQNQILNVIVYPNYQGATTVYQWMQSKNVVSVVIVFPNDITFSTTTIYFSLNVPAVGYLFNQQGFDDFADASIQLPLANIPRADAMFAIPQFASPTLARAQVASSAS